MVLQVWRVGTYLGCAALSMPEGMAPRESKSLKDCRHIKRLGINMQKVCTERLRGAAPTCRQVAVLPLGVHRPLTTSTRHLLLHQASAPVIRKGR